jgi:hypothetical protein
LASNEADDENACLADVELAPTVRASPVGEIEVLDFVSRTIEMLVVDAKRVTDPNNRKIMTFICLAVSIVIGGVVATVLDFNKKTRASISLTQGTFPEFSAEQKIPSSAPVSWQVFQCLLFLGCTKPTMKCC